MSFANQNILTIIRRPLNPPFLAVSTLENEYAMSKLSGNEYMLYIILASNCNGYKYSFCPKYIQDRGFMSISTAKRALEALKEKGFIVDNKFYVCHPELQKELTEMTTQY